MASPTDKTFGGQLSDAANTTAETLATQYAAGKTDLVSTTAAAAAEALAAQVIQITGGGDITTQLTAAVNTLCTGDSATGGTIVFGPGEYVVTAQIAIPTQTVEIATGKNAVLQRRLRITGQGGGEVGDLALGEPWTPPRGGTIIDFRYAAGPKILSVGSGSLEIDRISLIDTTDGTQDFIHKTLTTLSVHDCTFYGKTVTTPTQDAIVGGAEGNDLGFQTRIFRNLFSRIRRGYYGNNYANSVIVADNSFAVGCGGESAIELDGTGGFNEGTEVRGNLIEMASYTYGIKCTNNTYRNFFQNSFYDPGAGTTSYYYFDASSQDNLIIVACADRAAKPLISGAGEPGITVIDPKGASGTIFAHLVKCTLGIDGFVHYVGTGEVILQKSAETNGSELAFGRSGSGFQYIQSRKNGSGTALPFKIFTDAASAFEVNQDGTIVVPGLAGVGNRAIGVDATGKLIVMP